MLFIICSFFSPFLWIIILEPTVYVKKGLAVPGLMQ